MGWYGFAEQLDYELEDMVRRYWYPKLVGKRVSFSQIPYETLYRIYQDEEGRESVFLIVYYAKFVKQVLSNLYGLEWQVMRDFIITEHYGIYVKVGKFLKEQYSLVRLYEKDVYFMAGVLKFYLSELRLGEQYRKLIQDLDRINQPLLAYYHLPSECLENVSEQTRNTIKSNRLTVSVLFLGRGAEYKRFTDADIEGVRSMIREVIIGLREVLVEAWFFGGLVKGVLHKDVDVALIFKEKAKELMPYYCGKLLSMLKGLSKKQILGIDLFAFSETEWKQDRLFRPSIRIGERFFPPTV